MSANPLDDIHAAYVARDKVALVRCIGKAAKAGHSAEEINAALARAQDAANAGASTPPEKAVTRANAPIGDKENARTRPIQLDQARLRAAGRERPES